jgi:hypothetical protein
MFSQIGLNIGIFFLAALVCLGCAPVHNNPKAFDGVNASYPNANQQMAEDMAQRLASAFPPDRTKFSVDMGAAFGVALDHALRRSGFQISSDGIPLSYSVDVLSGTDSPTLYAHLVFPDGAGISQIYSLSGGLAVPSGNIVKTGLPDTVMHPTKPPIPAAPAPKPVYSLAASPDHLLIAEGATVSFTLSRDGRPADGGLKPHFEANPAFPNLKTTARTVDRNGTITVKGLRPVKTGQAALRLVIDKDTYVETVLTVAERPVLAAMPAPAVQAAVPPAPAPASAVQTAVKPVIPAVMPAPAPISVPAARSAVSTAKPVSAPIPVSSRPSIAAADLPAVSSAVPTPEWVIRAGLLRRQLEDWTLKSGYQLIWKAPHDFDMEADVVFRDDFIGAVKRLFTRMHEGGNLLRATIYQDNRVLEIVEE